MANEVLENWFKLYDAMLRDGVKPIQARPPSLRDAIYATLLARTREGVNDLETTEIFVNGMEMGAMTKLREAWERSGL